MLWVASLENYNFTLSYRAAKQNQDADGLSRVTQDVVQAICHYVSVSGPLVDSVCMGSTSHLANVGVASVQHISQIDMKAEQSKDADLARVVSLVRSGSQPRGRNLGKESPCVQKYLREWNRLTLNEGILYRTASQDRQQVRQLVVPGFLYKVALKGPHVGRQI